MNNFNENLKNLYQVFCEEKSKLKELEVDRLIKLGATKDAAYYQVNVSEIKCRKMEL